MTYLATTRGSLLRARVVSDYGDDVDDNDQPPVYANKPISLIERSKRVQDPDSLAWRTVRYVEARVPSTWALEDGDRVRDDRTGTVYAIASSTGVPRSLAGQASLTLELSVTD